MKKVQHNRRVRGTAKNVEAFPGLCSGSLNETPRTFHWPNKVSKLLDYLSVPTCPLKSTRTMLRRTRLFSVSEEHEHHDEETEGIVNSQEEDREGEDDAGASEEEAETVASPTSHKALPYNPHFPNTNQTKHCWSSYVNYHQCIKLKVKTKNHPQYTANIDSFFSFW